MSKNNRKQQIILENNIKQQKKQWTTNRNNRKKIENHRNVMQSFDKLVLLYLFLLNANYFNTMYARDYRLLKLLKELENGFNFTMPHPTS